MTRTGQPGRREGLNLADSGPTHRTIFVQYTYSHAVKVPEGSRLLYISGEVGVLPDGTLPEGIEAQAEACWRNIIAILADAGMGVGDLVKITTYLVRPEDLAPAGAAWAKHFGDARPGSATITVNALVVPEWLIEIEAVAAAKA